MKYISTRGQSKPLSFSEILLGGLAPVWREKPKNPYLAYISHLFSKP